MHVPSVGFVRFHQGPPYLRYGSTIQLDLDLIIRAAPSAPRPRRDLLEVAARLGGAGPGLTPAGDDALGGILFALKAMGCDDDLVAVARRVRTTAISGAFLLWAARGQALAPVHDLLAAAVAGDVPAARSAARALGNVGHSSGADFAQGLCWGWSGRCRAGKGRAHHSRLSVGRRGHPPLDA